MRFAHMLLNFVQVRAFFLRIFSLNHPVEYRPLILTLKVSQPHQSSPRTSGSGLHGNNAARSARAEESDQINPPMTGLHQWDTFAENLKVIGHKILNYFIFVTSLQDDFSRKVVNVWKFVKSRV